MADMAFHSEAAAEFEEALCWYAERSERAAQGFEEAVSNALHDIESAPERWPLIDRRHRIRLLEKRYPYHVVYRVDDGVPTVIAVAHHRRKPRYWSWRR